MEEMHELVEIIQQRKQMIAVKTGQTKVKQSTSVREGAKLTLQKSKLHPMIPV